MGIQIYWRSREVKKSNFLYLDALSCDDEGINCNKTRYVGPEILFNSQGSQTFQHSTDMTGEVIMPSITARWCPGMLVVVVLGTGCTSCLPPTSTTTVQ